MESLPQQLSLLESLAPSAQGVDIDTQAGRLADWVMQEMEREGLNGAAQQRVLMDLHIRTVVDSYLVKLPSRHRWQFVVRLIDAINQLEDS